MPFLIEKIIPIVINHKKESGAASKAVVDISVELDLRSANVMEKISIWQQVQMFCKECTKNEGASDFLAQCESESQKQIDALQEALVRELYEGIYSNRGSSPKAVLEGIKELYDEEMRLTAVNMFKFIRQACERRPFFLAEDLEAYFEELKKLCQEELCAFVSDGKLCGTDRALLLYEVKVGTESRKHPTDICREITEKYSLSSMDASRRVRFWHVFKEALVDEMIADEPRVDKVSCQRMAMCCELEIARKISHAKKRNIVPIDLPLPLAEEVEKAEESKQVDRGRMPAVKPHTASGFSLAQCVLIANLRKPSVAFAEELSEGNKKWSVDKSLGLLKGIAALQKECRWRLMGIG